MQQERRYNIVAASDVISEMNKNIDRVNEIFKVSYHKRDSLCQRISDYKSQIIIIDRIFWAVYLSVG